MTQFNQEDITNLNKIIYHVAKDQGSMVPEILGGFEYIPASGSKEDLIFRFYEDYLIDNEFCSLSMTSWTPNSTISDYKPLKLENKGRVVVIREESIESHL